MTNHGFLLDSGYFASLFEGVTVHPFSWPVGISIAIVIVLLLLSGYMSSSETAFFSLTPGNISEIKNSSNSSDKKLLYLLENSEQLLATILIGNNIVNIAMVFLSNYAISELVDFGSSKVLQFVLQTIGLTFILLLFGEISPKVIAQQDALAFSRFSAPIMARFYKIIAPFSRALMHTSSSSKRRKKNRGYTISVDDLSKAVELTEDKTPAQSEIMEGIIKFHDKTAVEIMVPRIDMVDIEYNASFRQVLEIINESGNSRLPVYEGTQDTIRGVLYIKDCIPYISSDSAFEWQKLIRPAYFVPENKQLDELLEEFRAGHIHMAIVVDEYGGTSGLVTLEDILEEIVGEISDEYDEDELPYTALDDGSYLFQAKTQINDFCRLLDIDQRFFDDVEQDVDTLGGVFLEMKQEIPHVGESVFYHGMELQVTEMDKFRIRQLRVLIPKDLGENEDPAALNNMDTPPE